MESRLDVELDFTTDLSPLELALRVAPLVREAVEAVRESLRLSWSLIFSFDWLPGKLARWLTLVSPDVYRLSHNEMY